MDIERSACAWGGEVWVYAAQAVVHDATGASKPSHGDLEIIIRPPAPSCATHANHPSAPKLHAMLHASLAGLWQLGLEYFTSRTFPSPTFSAHAA
jgi:hypothetical protein